MEIPWGSDIANRFITNVGLVTTQGIYGYNIMACEWTHQLSYKPALIGISVHPRHATYAHIRANNEFGVSIASSKQSVLSSVAGKESGKYTDKVKIAEELGFTFSRAKKINVLMPDTVSVSLECTLHNEIQLGDHTLFVGAVIEGRVNPDAEPLAYHAGKYWQMTNCLAKPSPEEREKIKLLFEKYKK